jgi:hypothetical protein
MLVGQMLSRPQGVESLRADKIDCPEKYMCNPAFIRGYPPLSAARKRICFVNRWKLRAYGLDVNLFDSVAQFVLSLIQLSGHKSEVIP